MTKVKVNLHLKELTKENFLIGNSKKIKAQHRNKGKLDLNKYGSRVLSKNFVNEISEVLHWGNSNANTEKCNFEDDLTAKKYNVYNTTLKTIPSDNINKLILLISTWILLGTNLNF